MAYTLKSKNHGTVKFKPMKTGLVESESESYGSSITSNPIEKGADINDHVTNDAGTFSISGEIVGGVSAINALKKMRDSRDIITYTGKTKVNNLVFQDLKFDYTYKNKKGASFSAKFKRVQLVSKNTKPKGEAAYMTEQDEGKSKNKQLHKTQSRGMATVASAAISAAALKKLKSSYAFASSIAPLTRITGGYDGMR